ncbi:TadE/TadG family type IV pilus assembly protein [Arthrobacter sp. TMN-37]
MKRKNERGAVAVEFAIILPVLVLILMGIVEYGRAYNVQISLTQAAREGVRVMAITNDPLAAKTSAKNAANASAFFNPGVGDSNILPSPTCTGVPGQKVTVTVKYTLTTLTGIAGPFAMSGKAVMLCGG